MRRCGLVEPKRSAEAMRRFRGRDASTEKQREQGEQVARSCYIPSNGERVELKRCGIARTGTVWYADQLQVLIKWDDGGSSSLRLGSENLGVVAPAAAPHCAPLNGHAAESRNGHDRALSGVTVAPSNEPN
jgi:hypothetical protein